MLCQTVFNSKEGLTLHNIKAAVFVVIAVWLGVVGGVAQTDQTFTVKDIIFEGLDQIALVPVMDQLTFGVGDTITVQDIQESGQRLGAMGVFKSIVPDLRQEPDGVVVIFQVQENPVIRAIEISGNRQYQVSLDFLHLKIPFFWEIIKPDKVIEILNEHNVVPNQIVNLNDLKDALQAISKIYQEKGYTLFQIDEQQIQNSIQNSNVLRIPIREYIIEDILIQGLEPEQEAIARALVSLPQDQPATAAQLQKTIAALTNSIYFTGVGNESVQFQPGSKVDKVVLALHMKPRQLLEAPSVIRNITFEGNTAYSNSRLYSVLGNWDKEKTFENIDLLHLLRSVFDLYHDNGYTRMTLEMASLNDGDLVVAIDEGAIHEVSVKLRYDGGYTDMVFPQGQSPQVTYFELDESGDPLEVPDNQTHTKPYVIQQALQIKAGDLYNENTLRDTVRTLLNLGYFDDVQIGLNPTDPALNEVDVNLNVIEKKKSGNFNGALSLSDDGLVGKLSVSEKNLFGTGQDISLEYDRGIFGPARTNWSLIYSANGFFQLYKDFNIRLFQSFERPSFDEELSRTGGELTLVYPLTSNTDLTMGGRHEIFQECLRNGEDCQAPGVTDSVRVGLIRDTRDIPSFPMQGGRETIQVEQAGGFSVGTEFTKIDGSLVHHFFTFEDQNISARVFAGWGTGMPSQEKYTFGGAGSVRGLVEKKVDAMAFANLEYRVKWIDGFSTALFSDWGVSNAHSLLGTAGLEARVAVPLVGMTRLILAWPINDPSYKTFAPRFQFSFGSMF